MKVRETAWTPLIASCTWTQGTLDAFCEQYDIKGEFAFGSRENEKIEVTREVNSIALMIRVFGGGNVFSHVGQKQVPFYVYGSLKGEKADLCKKVPVCKYTFESVISLPALAKAVDALSSAQVCQSGSATDCHLVVLERTSRFRKCRKCMVHDNRVGSNAQKKADRCTFLKVKVLVLTTKLKVCFSYQNTLKFV
mmetsp:Transcript_13214/g.37523  ORF Transcript_13214/g.37523 Transcript_13214/m.37523 type:complete len:194 (-) Transcript_13214:590-1171(-)